MIPGGSRDPTMEPERWGPFNMSGLVIRILLLSIRKTKEAKASWPSVGDICTLTMEFIPSSPLPVAWGRGLSYPPPNLCK